MCVCLRLCVSPHSGVENSAKEIHCGQKMLIRSRNISKEKTMFTTRICCGFYLRAAALTSEELQRTSTATGGEPLEVMPPVDPYLYIPDYRLCVQMLLMKAADLTTCCAYGRCFQPITPGPEVKPLGRPAWLDESSDSLAEPQVARHGCTKSNQATLMRSERHKQSHPQTRADRYNVFPTCSVTLARSGSPAVFSMGSGVSISSPRNPGGN